MWIAWPCESRTKLVLGLKPKQPKHHNGVPESNVSFTKSPYYHIPNPRRDVERFSTPKRQIFFLMRKMGDEQWQTRRNNDKHGEFNIQSRNQRQPPTVIQSLRAKLKSKLKENDENSPKRNKYQFLLELLSLLLPLFDFKLWRSWWMWRTIVNAWCFNAWIVEKFHSDFEVFMCCDEWRINFCCDFCFLSSENNEWMMKKMAESIDTWWCFYL